MENAFKTKVEPQVEAPIEKKETTGVIEDTDGIDKAGDKDQLKLGLWEAEKGHKFAENYFDVRNIVAEDKIVKMQVGQIDKHIKGLLESKGMEKSINNYTHILTQIEMEIGSIRLESFKRLQKITGYINIINKINKLKELKEQYSFNS